MTTDNELCMQVDISTVNQNTNSKIHQSATLVACAETCVVQNFIFGHRLIHHPQRVALYLSSPVSRKDKVTRCQYLYNIQISVLKTNFGKKFFNHAIPHEWNRLPFELKLMPDERTYRKIL